MANRECYHGIGIRGFDGGSREPHRNMLQIHSIPEPLAATCA
jgi:hypothetical protein